MNNNDPRPIEILNREMKRFPKVTKAVNIFRKNKGTTIPDWPNWCFLPMKYWSDYINEFVGESKGTHDYEFVMNTALVSAIASWRYTQGIYTFDPDLTEALTKSSLSGRLPSEILFRLPEWCIYIETNNMKWMRFGLFGFWVHLEYCIVNKRNELRFLLDTDEGLVQCVIHIGDWTISEAIERSLYQAHQNSESDEISQLLLNKVHLDMLTDTMTPLVSMILYVCSQEPQIEDEREPLASPKFPRPKKTKNGWRLFPAKTPRIWSVGKKIGEQLRQDNFSEPSNRTVKNHIRRGHWHGFWKGPRNGERKFFYRWIPPLIVRGSEEQKQD